MKRSHIATIGMLAISALRAPTGDELIVRETQKQLEKRLRSQGGRRMGRVKAKIRAKRAKAQGRRSK
jgi:hypothetical protein